MQLFDRLRAVSNRILSLLSGTSTAEPESADDSFDRGEIVRDCDSDSEKEIVVVETKEERAETFTVPGTEKTVAEYNPEYPARDQVIEVRFIETLDAYLDEWTVAGVLETEATDKLDAGDPYFYPESRLTPVEQLPLG